MEVVLEIDARLPTVQASQTTVDRSAEPRSDVPVRPGTGSDFFISPVLRFDSRSLTVIFQVRDSGSGDVIRQFPPETVVARYREDPSSRPFVVAAGTGTAGGEDFEIVGAGNGVPDGDEAAPTGAASPGGPAAGRATADGTSADPVDLVA